MVLSQIIIVVNKWKCHVVKQFQATPRKKTTNKQGFDLSTPLPSVSQWNRKYTLSQCYCWTFVRQQHAIIHKMFKWIHPHGNSCGFSRIILRNELWFYVIPVLFLNLSLWKICFLFFEMWHREKLGVFVGCILIYYFAIFKIKLPLFVLLSLSQFVGF